ncbi:DUF7146 domain-containing protein [Nitratireductor rhodophyticola]|uniref:DUF7146 domain-containing protein n=1 Tax=Nitratireductor rhodophyticola TaxID=2854036 RepID=UPI003008A2E5
MHGDLKEIRAALNLRVLDVCERLLPHGRLIAGQWESCNPRVAGDDRKLPALKVRVHGGEPGAWQDWRNGRDGYAGDIIGLVGYLNGTDTKGALAWARDFLGLRSMSREERQAMRFAAEAQAKKREQKAAQDRLKKRRRARELFSSIPLQAGPSGAAYRHAVAYFEARHMPLHQVPALNKENFCFSAATEWWRGATYRTEPDGRRMKTAPGPSFPAVHSAMRQWNGEISACHVTFLDPVEAAKAPVQPAKLMFGEAQGAVIELAMGPAQAPFWDCEAPHPLIIGEGIESVGPLAIAVPEARVWAAGSLSGMRHAPVHLPCISEVFVARDNNTGNAQAQKQLDAALVALEAAGKPLNVMASHVGDDFNDLADDDEGE